MGRVAEIWRHPIKSHGREALKSVDLAAGATMPWDRHWAVTHEASKFDHDDPRWVMCRNFMIGVATPGLAGIWAKLDTDSATLTLTHADLGSFTFCPDDPAEVPGFLHWVLPLCPADKRQPTGVVAAPGRGMTDSSYPTISIMNRASHAAVETQLGHSLQHERWRGNIWVNGPELWEEFDWTGRTVRIGQAELKVEEPIRRCMATAANPHTGQRDTDTLGALRDGWDHQHFGVYATVTKGGHVAVDDALEVL